MLAPKPQNTRTMAEVARELGLPSVADHSVNTMLHRPSGQSIDMPVGSSQGLLNREFLVNSDVQSSIFGGHTIEEDSKLTESIEAIGLEVERFLGGASSQAYGTITRFPSIMLQEVSDLILEPLSNDEDTMGRLFSGIDNYAEGISSDLMDNYYSMLDSQGHLMDEEGNPTFAFKLGSGAASLAEAIGLTAVTGNPVAAAAFFGALQQTETYSKAIAQGKSPQEAFMIANATGITMGILERIGMNHMLKIARDPAKRFAQRAAQGAITESIQEGSQEASVIGIEGATGVDSMSLREAGSQVGESMLIGGILGGGVTPSLGMVADSQQARGVRAGKLDSKVVDEFASMYELGLYNNLNTEKETWVDAVLANPKTNAGKRLKEFQKKAIDILNSNITGQQFEDIFKTEKQQREHIQGLVQKLGVAGEAESRVIQRSMLQKIDSEKKKLSKSQKDLEAAGSLVVENYAKKFDEVGERPNYFKSLEGKSVSEALVLMRKELREVRNKIKDTLDDSLVGDAGLIAQQQSLEDTIKDFEAIEEQQMAEFDDTKMFTEGLESLPKYKRLVAESKIIEEEIAQKEAEYKEWAEKTNQPEMLDYVENERISVKGDALRRLTRDKSINAFMKGLASGRALSDEYLLGAVKAVKRFVKSMPALKGTVLNKDSKDKIEAELEKMIAPLETKKMSREDIETQSDKIAQTINDMIDVAHQMNSEEAYKIFRGHLKSKLKKHVKKKGMDPDLNDALLNMSKMMTSKRGFDVVWAEDISAEIGKMYRPMMDKLYQIMSQEKEGTLDSEQLAESYAGMLDAVEYMSNYGYVPDSRYIKRAAQTAAAKKAIGMTVEEMRSKGLSDARIEKVRKSRKYLVQDGFFNPNFETLNTLWVKLGLQDIPLLDLTEADMGYRNDKVRWNKDLKAVLKKIGITQKDLEAWSDVDNEQEFTLKREDGTSKLYTLTPAMVMQRIMNLRNKKVREQMMSKEGPGYTEEFIEELEASLNMPGQKEFIDEMLKVYSNFYDELSPVYRELFLISMPKVDIYSPLVRESREGDSNELHDVKFLGPDGLAIPSFAKRRTQSDNDFMDIGIVDVMTHYVESAVYFKNYQRQISDVSDIIADKDVQRGIKSVIGVRGYNRLKKHIDHVKDMPEHKTEVKNEMWDYFNKVYVVNKLMFKMNQIFKQYSSAFGLIEDVPFSYSMRNMHKMFNPFYLRNWKKKFNENETFRNRSEHIDPDYNILLDNDTVGIFTEQNKWVKAGMKPTTIGDWLAIVAGGGIYYDYLVSQGVSHKEAVDTVVKKAEMSQQSSLPSNMTLLQKDKSPFARTIRMFSSSAVALMNMQMQSWAKYQQGEISKKELFRSMALYQFVVPAFYAAMAGQISFDDGDDLAWGLAHAGAKGNFGSLPIVGEGLDAVMIKAINTMTPAELTSYGIRDIENPVGEFYKITMKGMKAALGEDDFTEEDMVKVLFEITDSVSRLGSENIFNSVSGAIEFAGQDDAAGLLRFFGYPEKTADKLAGNN